MQKFKSLFSKEINEAFFEGKYYNIELINRFAHDYKIPFSCIHNHDIFVYELFTFDTVYNSLSLWLNLCQMIRNDYNDNPHEFLRAYYQVRDNIITTIDNTEEMNSYKHDLDKVKFYKDLVYPKTKYATMYNHETATNDELYWSFDMKSANFQVLKYNHIFDSFGNINTYEDLINYFCDNKNLANYIINSKYTRQVIFGKLLPNKTIKLEKAYMHSIYQMVKEIMGEDIECMIFNADEFVIKAGTKEQKKQIEEKISTQFFDIRIEQFALVGYDYFVRRPNNEDYKLGSFYLKSSDTNLKLRGANSNYMKMLLALCYKQEIKKFDRYICFDSCAVEFIEDLYIKQIEK